MRFFTVDEISDTIPICIEFDGTATRRLRGVPRQPAAVVEPRAVSVGPYS
jgi:hypothetical protein